MNKICAGGRCGFLRRLSTLALAVGMVFSAAGARAASDSIVVSGFLEDDAGEPFSGLIATRIRFHADPATPAYLEEHTTDTLVLNGVFSVPVRVSQAALGSDRIFYSVAMDTGGDGLDESDTFDERFELHAVPLAMKTKEAEFYATHGGHVPGQASRAVSGAETIFVAPFHSPAGGVKFNRMTIQARPTQTVPPFESTISYGIYDEKGHAVALSGPVVLNVTSPNLSTVSVPATRLNPNAIYFTGWAFSNDGPGPFVAKGILIPDSPFVGEIVGIAPGGVIPGSFNLGDIQHDVSPYAISITLTMD